EHGLAFLAGVTAAAVSRACAQAERQDTVIGPSSESRRATGRSAVRADLGERCCGVTSEVWVLVISGLDDGPVVRRQLSERWTRNRTATGPTTGRRRPSGLAH